MAEYLVLTGNAKEHYKGLMSDYFYNLLLVRDDFFAIGAVDDNTACGYLIAQRDELGYLIQDVFVHPDFRRKGIGTGLIHTLVRIAGVYTEDIDCHFVQDADTSFHDFLASTSLFTFEEDEETKVFRGEADLLYNSEKLAPFMNLDRASIGCLDFYEELPIKLRKQFISDCEEHDYLPTYFIPAVKDSVTKYCYAMLTSDQKEVSAYAKINASEDTAYIESVFCKKGYEKQLLTILGCVLKQMKEAGNFRYLEACVVSEDVESMLKRLLPTLTESAQGVNAYWNYKDVAEVTK